MADDQPQYHEIVGPDGVIRRIAYRYTPNARADLPPIMWLSGFQSRMIGEKADAVAAFAASRDASMLRFDYSGQGESSGQPEDGAISDWLEEAEAIFSHLAGRPAVLVGSSMGAWLALLMATRLPGEVAALILIAPAWNMTEDLMWARFPPDVRKTIMESGVYRAASNYEAGGYQITRKLIEDGRKHLVGPAPFDPGCPVRIIHGMRDADVAAERSLQLVSLLAHDDVRLTLVKDAEHRLARDGDIALLLQTIGEFV